MTNDEDIKTFARGYFRRFGSAAPGRAREWAGNLRESGDEEGARVWNRVADEAVALSESAQAPAMN